MRMLYLAVSLAVFLNAAVAPAISRVGNLVVGDKESGVTVSVPPHFGVIDEFGPGKVRMSGYFPKAGRTQALEGADFAVDFPELKTFSREELSLYFVNDGFEKRALADACVDVYKGVLGSTATYVVVWGVGRGFVFAGGNGGQSGAALESMITSLALPKGACRW